MARLAAFAFAALGLMTWTGASAAAQTPSPIPLDRAVAVPATPQLVWLDTDIGDDIDDAFALALEEIGSINALLELQSSLKQDGLDLPNWEFITGGDTNIHVAFLTRLPIIARHPHTTDEFLLDGRRMQVCRGFAEIEVQVAPDLTYTLIAAHLKSRRTEFTVDEAAERLAEAKILRQLITDHLQADPHARLIVLGDLNDTPNAESTRTIIGRGKSHLIDTRPAERNGDRAADASTHYHPRDITWTDYYGYEDTYSRIDYILISPALLSDWLPAETYLPTIPNWGDGSDHRPIVAAFEVSP